MPLRLKSLENVLNPQAETAEVLRSLLAWIDAADLASQKGLPAPPAVRGDSTSLFPEGEWWLTDLQKRIKPEDDLHMGDEVAYDDNALTRKAAEAWWHDSESSDSATDGEESEASLPAGPSIKRKKTSDKHQMVSREGTAHSTTRMQTETAGPARRLRVKTKQHGP